MYLTKARLGVALAVLAVAAVLVTGCSGAADAPRADGTVVTTTSLPVLDLPVVDHAHGHVTELNGTTPPGISTLAKDQQTLLRAPDGNGHESVVHRTVRAPGTRAPIHVHGYGGTTCVLEGEMTLLIEGGEPALAKAGSCYYMPPEVTMSGFNTGDVDAVMLDFFVVPEGEPDWVDLETE